MNRKNLLLVLAVLLAASIAFAGCTGSEDQPAVTGKTLQERELVVGIDSEYPPYAYIDPKSGEAAGFDIESMKWIAEKKGLTVSFQPTAWDGIITALEVGNIDMVYSGLTILPERAERVAFTIPYYKVNQALAINNDSSYTMDDFLNGTLVVGCQRGTSGQYWVEDNLIANGTMAVENLVTYDNFPLVITDLQNKRIQAAFYDTVPLADAIEGKTIHIVGEIDTNELYGVAVRKDDTELLAVMNEGLTELMADPYWDELKAKYNM
jgi:polar amino acid transport system substrate-binding protein